MHNEHLPHSLIQPKKKKELKSHYERILNIHFLHFCTQYGFLKDRAKFQSTGISNIQFIPSIYGCH